MVALVLVAVSVGLSNFAAAISIGVSGIDARTRLRVGVIFGLFETSMPMQQPGRLLPSERDEHRPPTSGTLDLDPDNPLPMRSRQLRPGRRADQLALR
jgi:hypothetical protein